MITHPAKVLFPDDGITKGELAAYYEAVGSVMLPHLYNRPVTMERYPAGIGQKGFWQKDVSRGFPAWLERVEVPKKGGVVRHALINDERALQWMTNQNTITPHVWTSRAPHLDHPDICIFDLDPPDGGQPERLRAAAAALREALDELGLPSWIKTTGSKGFHVAVPLDGRADPGTVARFAHRVGRLMVARYPKALTQEFYKSDRAGRILVDTGRNEATATFAAAYAVRARRGAPVSAPCTWDEALGGEIGPQSLTLQNVPARIARLGDLWADMRRHKRSLTRAIERLQALMP